MDLFGWGVIAGICSTMVITIVRSAWENRESRLDKLEKDILKLFDIQHQNEKQFVFTRKWEHNIHRKVNALIHCVDFKDYMNAHEQIIDAEEETDDERAQ